MTNGTDKPKPGLPINFPLLLILMAGLGVYQYNNGSHAQGQAVFDKAKSAVVDAFKTSPALIKHTQESDEDVVEQEKSAPKPYFRTTLNDTQEFTISKKTEADIKIMDMIERHQEQEEANARYQAQLEQEQKNLPKPEAEAQLDQESEPVNMSVIPTVNYGV